MKFFGWGRKKDPPPPHPSVQEIFQKPDAARTSSHSPEEVTWRSALVTEAMSTRPSKDFHEQRGAVSGGEEPEPGADDLGNQEAWEDRLQETIRFVFSHEQEGLLAIGTFALDQLAGVRDSLDGRPKHLATGPINSSRRNSVSSVQLGVRELGSSDDETKSHHESTLRSPIRRKELPVFGDHGAYSGLADGHASPIVLVRHTTRDPPPSPTALDKQPAHDHSDEDQFSLPGVCGLFASRRRKKIDKEMRKKVSVKRVDEGECELQSRDSKGGARRAYERLWRPGCNSSSAPAKVAPDKRKKCPTADAREPSHLKGPPCIANIGESGAGTGMLVVPSFSQPMLQCPPKPCPKQAVENGERRKRGHNFGKGWACAQNGNWIRTDSEFVVLEM